MKAIFLVHTGKPEHAFEIRETDMPSVTDDQVLIQTEASGINFADLVAREGMYRDAPPRPSILGYDVAGRITACGKNVHHLQPGDRVAALTRFGGYAEYVSTDARATAKIPGSMSVTTACSLATQYCTAYYCAAIAANVREGERVIIHSAAGGVGHALLQYCLYKKCHVIATTGSSSKINLLLREGAADAINTSSGNFSDAVKKITGGKNVDVIFDALGGKFVRQGMGLLSAGGRIVCYGASQMTGTNLFSRIKAALQFGFYHPAQFMMPSKSLIGVNMLHIADQRPDLIQHCLQEVMRLFDAGVFHPNEGTAFKADEVAKAHRFIEERKAIGKVVLKW